MKILILIFLSLFLLVGCAQNKQPDHKIENINSTTMRYHDNIGKFSIDYPTDWKNQDELSDMEIPLGIIPNLETNEDRLTNDTEAGILLFRFREGDNLDSISESILSDPSKYDSLIYTRNVMGRPASVIQTKIRVEIEKYDGSFKQPDKTSTYVIYFVNNRYYALAYIVNTESYSVHKKVFESMLDSIRLE